MLANGTLLQNRYLIKRPLAQGGMGTVYEAEAIHLGHAPVAVKETFYAQDWLREQFQREASMLARLRHDALPRVSDHFLEGPGQFLVMEFIPGEDLDGILSEKLKNENSPFEWRQVAVWADRLLDALDYIHNQHPPIIHRDIKPSNLKLTPRGELFLIDFGLAKDATTPTKPGRSVHAYTLNYAPPEQLKGTGTDVRSDLYSLGATLYHLLSGEMPENAKVREEVMRYGVPDPLALISKINPQVPAPMARVISRAMRLERPERYQAAREMREALHQALQAIAEGVAEPRQLEAEPHPQKGRERRQRGTITRELQEAERRQQQEEEERRQQEEARQHQLEEERRQQELVERQRQEAEFRKLEEEKRLREAEERLLAEQRRQDEEKRLEEARQRKLEEQQKQEAEKQRQEQQRIAEQRQLEQEQAEIRRQEEERQRLEVQRIAEQKRLEQEQAEQRRQEEEKQRLEEQRLAEQKRLEQELAEQRRQEEEKQRQEEQRIAEQKRLEQELAEKRKQEEEKRQQEEQRIAEQKRLEQEQAEQHRQEEEKLREELKQREFERKRKKEIERRKRPGQVTNVQATKTSPKFKPGDKPTEIEKAPESSIVKPPLTEIAPVMKADPLPEIESLPQTDARLKQEQEKDRALTFRSPRVRLIAGAVTAIIVLLIFLLWSQRKNDATLKSLSQDTPLIQTKPLSQPQPSASPAVKSVERLRYWFQQFVEDETSSSLVARHELASQQKFKLHFEPRAEGYLYLLALDNHNGQLTPYLSDQRIKPGRDFVFPNRKMIRGLEDGKQLRFTVLFARNRIKNFRDMLGQGKSQSEPIEALKALVGAVPASEIKDLNEGGTAANAVSSSTDNSPLVFDINLKFKSN